MRLILYVFAFPQLSETFIVNKFLGLLKRGWDVQIVCQRSDQAQWKRYPDLMNRPGIRRRVHYGWPHRPRWLAAILLPAALLVCLFANLRGTLRYWKAARRLWGLPAVLRRFYMDAPFIALRPDLIHFEFGALAVEQVDLKTLLGCKVTVSFRGYDLNFSGLDQPDYYQAVWQQVDALHLLGQDLWDRAKRRGCPPDKPHVLIPPAIEFEKWVLPKRRQFGAAGIHDHPLRILSVGRLEWKKGYEFALQAVRFLEDTGVACQYRIVGNGAYHEALAFARHQFDLEKYVELLGSLPQQDVMEQMRWADVLLHAAVSEGFCNVVLEAQAMQLPVVCSDADGLPENVDDGVTGFVVPRRDPKALASRLEQLAKNPFLRIKMGAVGRVRVNSKFQIQDQINQFDIFYSQVLESDHES